MKDKRESLLEEINLLNERIRHLKRFSKERTAETDELIRLIIELDSLGPNDKDE